VASKCFRLDDDQQKKWDAIQALSKEEITRAEKTFIQDIMGKQQTFFNRVDIGKYLKDYDKNTLTNKVASNIKEVVSSVEDISPLVSRDPFMTKQRPRIQDWEDEQKGVNQSVLSKNISSHIKESDKLKVWRTNTESAINNLNTEYNEAKASGDEDRITAVEAKTKAIAKEAGLSKKALLGKSWDKLTPNDKLALSISAIPDKSLTFGGLKEFFDMEYFMEFLEEMTGAPFYSILRRMAAASGSAETAKELILQRITTDPHFKNIRTDEKSLERVAQELNARNKTQGVEHPANLLEEEVYLADAIEDIYNHYKPYVRYLRFMRTEAKIEELNKEFPDAVEAGKGNELKLALDIRNTGNLDDLWNYLYNLDWGVINHGFDPRLISNPELKINRTHGLRTTRGKGRLLRREQVEYPEGKMGQNVLGRLASYIEQMEIQWRIEPELETLAGYWKMVGDKFKDWGQIEKGLETWLERIQNIGLGYNFYDRIVRRIWRQAMTAIFIEPAMSLRNSFQALIMHPDRTELGKLIYQHIPVDLKEKVDIYYRTFVAELGGIRKDWLHTGEKGFLIPEWWNRLADNLSLYGKSDDLPRLWSFKASFNKAYRATEQFKQDGDVAKWFKNSGAIHLRDTERNYVLSHYLGQLDTKFDQGVAGLRDASGEDMANFYVAQRITDMTNFKYRRSERGIIEMGKTGTTLWNLIVFPRGYAQRLYFQAEKIKNAFSGTATWAEARTGFNDIMKMFVVAQLFGTLLSTLTGRKKNPYDPLNILFGWTFGGLFIGIATEITKMFSDIVTAINPFGGDDKAKKEALTRIPQELTKSASSLIPFYKRALDMVEVSMNKDNIDLQALRELRALIDKDYTPDKLEELDIATWEKIRKFSLGGAVTDLTKLEASMKKIEEFEAKLGQREIPGIYYTVGKFGSNVSTALKEIPDALINDQEGFSPLVLFYKDCESMWEPLFNLPSSERSAWRLEHPYEEAMLLFWEKYDKSVFTKGSKEGTEVINLLSTWFDIYSIDEYKHGHWANFTLPSLPLTNE
jgi:hypothetical protein